MMDVRKKQLQHLYNRAGFGWSPTDSKSTDSVNHTVKKLFVQSEQISPMRLITPDMLPKKPMGKLSASEKKELQKAAREFTNKLNINWLNQMTGTEQVLREKLTFFWHGHFACRSNNPFFLQELNNIQRFYALGNFKTLLMAVSKSAAMLEFLNNQQNKKEHPNENFARELMELFTVGRGNYSETDIKESARAFTGWGFNHSGEFEFRPKQHDFGAKQFMGQRGNFNGEDIINILLANKQTAIFICKKLYRFLVNDQVDEARVQELAHSFYESGYEIQPLVEKILRSDWFYEAANRGSKIKSPIELLVGINKLFKVNYEDPLVMIKMQQLMGQVLFFPPNVSGWSGGKNWIDSSTLMFRMKLPSVLLNDGVVEEIPKDEPEHAEHLMESEMETTHNAQAQSKVLKIQKQVHQLIKAHVNWDEFLSQFEAEHNGTGEEVAAFLLTTAPHPAIMQSITEIEKNSVKGWFLTLASLPEYQVC